ncbi:hypothetical protein BO94DRAFT_499347 [Aspergillus sclerotioniger CBS 115572]|uniref:Uncharacterized protein n=1 Tax=Aspergillus sclerotioniger CBS 115572 TaxID=1450535 RepID=A0A317VR36_9EURO|nr:hypothetical protein BO94DRAFT_499347 [Aspergillus sclerotioniger CBS 115572]PWY76019.1 hypothetical protein BO94DRAFT_499347 [Aspergillus sclerotioniger CBS 115572]
MEDEPPCYHDATRFGPASTTPLKDTQRPILENNSNEYALVSFSGTDRIRLVRFPDDLVTVVSETLRRIWSKGIQDVRRRNDYVELKLRGNPFAYSQDEEKIAIRKTVLGILETLAQEGWYVLPGAGGLGKMRSSGGSGEKDSLVIQRQEQPQSHLSWLCVSFDSDDLIHLIDAPFELARSVIDMFGDKVERCNQDLVSGNFEIKLRGNPWTRSSSDGAVQGRLILLDVLRCLQGQAYALSANLDLDGGDGGSLYRSRGEIWFCCR